MFAGLWYQHSQLRFFRNFPSKKWNAELTGTDLDEPEPIATINKEVALTKEITHVKSYIQRHIDKDIPVEKLAAEINVSVRQLQRILKTELHLTPKQYITILKLEKAEEMLHQGQWTVSEVAFQCGFADPSYFGAVFKKYFGQSPAEYRKTIL